MLVFLLTAQVYVCSVASTGTRFWDARTLVRDNSCELHVTLAQWVVLGILDKDPSQGYMAGRQDLLAMIGSLRVRKPEERNPDSP